MSSAQSANRLPVSLQAGLEQLCLDLSQRLGDDLLSVALYGPPAKHEGWEPDSGAVPVLIVLADASIGSLSKIAKLVRNAISEHDIVPFVLSETDLRSATDVFPVKFLDMQSSHLLLTGRDLLSELEISTEHLRLRCEQEVRNLTLRLRNVFLRTDSDEPRRRILTDSASSFFNTLSAILFLKTGITAVEPTAIVDDAATQLGGDRNVLDSLWKAGAGQATPAGDDLQDLYTRVTELVDRVAETIDAFDAADQATT